jgi:hypothetical protein
LLLCVPLVALAYSHVRIVRLTLVEDGVWVTRPGRAEPVRAVDHLPLEHAAVVDAVAGVAEIEFEDRTFVRLASGARLHLTELGLEDNGDRVTHLTLEQGTATFEVRPRRGDSTVVLAPQVRISFLGKATVRVDISPYANRVRVFRGQAVVETHADVSLRGGQMLEWVADSGQYRIARNLSPDSWDRWNDERSETLQAVASLTAPSVAGGGLATGYTGYGSGLGHRGYCGSWYYDPFFNSWMWTSYGYADPFFGVSRYGCGGNGFWWSPGGFFYGYPGYWQRPIFIRVRTPVDPSGGGADDGDDTTTVRARRRPRRPVGREDGPVLGPESPLFGSRRALRTTSNSTSEDAERLRRSSVRPADSARQTRRTERDAGRVSSVRRSNRSRRSVRRVQPRTTGRQVRRPATSRRPSTGSRGRTVRRPSRSSSSRSRPN